MAELKYKPNQRSVRLCASAGRAEILMNAPCRARAWFNVLHYGRSHQAEKGGSKRTTVPDAQES